MNNFHAVAFIFLVQENYSELCQISHIVRSDNFFGYLNTYSSKLPEKAKNFSFRKKYLHRDLFHFDEGNLPPWQTMASHLK